jgi:hypothetical protein
VAAPQKSASGASQAMPVGRFESDTRQQIITLTPMSPPTPGTAGQIVTQQLPTSGYLSSIWMLLQGTTTTTSAQSATVLAYPQPPWNFIRKIRVYTNMGVELVNLSGYGLYLYQSCLRTGLDIDTIVNSLTYAVTDGATNNTVKSRYLVHPTSLAASSSETWKAGYYLPIAWGTGGKAGLQLLQDDAVKYYLELTFGDLTDLYASTSGTPTLSNVSVTPMVETFSTPRNPANRPDLSYSKVILEETQPFDAGTGVTTFKMVTGNMVTQLIHELSNSTSANVAHPLDPVEVTLLRMDYAQTQVPYNLNPDIQLLRQAFLYGRNLPQGAYVWELAEALGLKELPTMRDVIDTLMLTNLQSEITLSGVTPNSSKLRTIKEWLVPNRNFGG